MHLNKWFLAGCMFAICLAAIVAGCASDRSEQALRASVAGLQTALGARDASTIEQTLAEDFIGPDGLDRQGARRMAQLAFLRHQQVSATLSPLEVTMQDKYAMVKFTAVLTGATGGWLSKTGQLYAVETGWRLQDGEWKLTSAKWTLRL